MYKFVRFTSKRRNDVLSFLGGLSEQTRTQLSVAGIDPRTLYLSFKDDWRNSYPICVYHGQSLVALGKLSVKGDIGFITSFVVSDRYQRKQIGTRLMKYLFALAVLNNAKKVILEVKKDNLNARRFFERLGYKLIRESALTYMMERIL